MQWFNKYKNLHRYWHIFIVLGLVFIVATNIFYGATLTRGAFNTWTQTDWSGGADGGTVAVHPTNQIDWNKYSSLNNVSGTASPSNVVLNNTNYTVTDDGLLTTTGLATGGGFSNGTNSSTTLTGSGVSASVALTGTSIPVNTFEQSMPSIPGTFVTNTGRMIGTSADTNIYLLKGNTTTEFYKYSTTSNTWTSLAAVPSTVVNGAIIRNGTDDEIYVIPGLNSLDTTFYKYSISGNSWTTLAALPAGVNSGKMLRNGSDNEIYVLRGSGGTGVFFYKYSISGNSWTTLTSIPTASSGGEMIRNGSDDEIYVLPGTSANFYKYSISGNSWTALTVVPAIFTGGTMIRNGSDNDIYVLQGNSATGFYKYSISGNSWTTLTVVPASVGSVTSGMIRNGADNDIYVQTGAGGTGFYKYSIAGNSWMTLTAVPGGLSSRAPMLRSGAADEIYVLQGNSTNGFYKYSIVGNSWLGSGISTLAPIPGLVGGTFSGAVMLRNSSDNDIYLLQASGTNGFFKYSLSGNAWTTLAVVPSTTSNGSTMIRNGSDDEIYVMKGGATSFYKYSISGNSWTTLTVAPAAVGTGSVMIRNGADNDIYLLRGSSSTSFYKYSISGNSWTTLTVVPSTVTIGGAMLRNGSDNDIYVLPGSGGTGFYKYSISGNSWTTLTVVPAALGSSSRMIRSGADNDIYVLQGTSTGFYKYSISGNSWTTLTVVPGSVGNGAVIIRNATDNDIYVLRGNVASITNFYKYSISGNSWTTFTSLPAAVNTGASMLRNGADSQIYILQSNLSTNLWRFTIDSTTYPSAGTFTSAVIDTAGVTAWGNLAWTVTLPASTTLTLATRSGATAVPDGSWSAWSAELSTAAGSAIASPAARYFQYRGSFSSSNISNTPTLNNVTAAYSAYPSAGNLVSSVFNTIEIANMISGLAWVEDASLPAGTTVTISLRTAPTAGGLTGTWTDFTNATANCSKVTDTVTCLDLSIPLALSSGENDQYLQYKVALTTTNPILTPTVGSVVTTYSVNDGSSRPGEGSINVVKTVINDNGGTKTSADFPLFVNGLPVSSGVTNTFPAGVGAYTVTETEDANYNQTFSGGCDLAGRMNLNNGDYKLCVVTNDDIGSPATDPLIPTVLDLVKVPSPLALPAGPGLVTYTYTLKNLGLTPVSNLTLAGDTCSPITLISGDSNTNAQLEADETWIYTCATTLLKTHTNTVVVTGWANGLSTADIASATVIVGGESVPPLIHVTKVPNPLTLPAGGGLVTYTEKISNPGSVALTNIILTDDKCGPMQYLAGDSNNDSKLDPTEIWTYTCQTFLTHTTTNTARASGQANGIVVHDFAIVTVLVAGDASSLHYSISEQLSLASSISVDKGLSAPVSGSILPCVPETLLKLATDDNAGTQADSTVYYCGVDGKRYIFPNTATYFSWYQNFSNIRIISNAQLMAIPLGGQVTDRPGHHLVKIMSATRVYAVSQHSVLRWVTTQEVARVLYGADWNTQVFDISVASYNSYQIGDPITLADITSGSNLTTSCTTATNFTSTLVLGSTDTQVRPLQELLQCLGYFPVSTLPSGYFGAVTQSAVKKFQSANNITPIGSVGPATRSALNGYH